MLDVLKFKSSMAEGVLDGGEDTIFLGDDKFNQFMKWIESLTEVQETEAVPMDVSEEHEIEKNVENTAEKSQQELTFTKPDTFVGDDDVKTGDSESREKANQEIPQSTASQVTSPQDLLATGLSFFTQLANTLKSPEAAQQLVSSITQKDETGKTYLKVPVENEAIIQNAVHALSSIFGVFIK